MRWKDLAHFYRECQECGHVDEYRDPAEYASDKWRDVKCKKCKSEALDYGSWRHPNLCTCEFCLSEVDE